MQKEPASPVRTDLKTKIKRVQIFKRFPGYCGCGNGYAGDGSPAYYPLIEGGSNWYECNAECELILDDTEELVFVVNLPDETERKRVAMALKGLPKTTKPDDQTCTYVEIRIIERL